MLALLAVLSQVGIGTLSVRHGVLPAVLGFSSSITGSQVVDQTNAYRSSLGLGTLSSDSRLVAAATAKGNNMCAEQYWAHVSISGKTPWSFIKAAGYNFSVAGENLARDFSDTGSVMTAWENSSSHKENLVNPAYRDIGVSVVYCSLLGSDTAIVVQMFGAGSSAVARAPSTLTAKATPRATPRILALLKTPEPSIEPTIEPTPASSPVLLALANPTLVLESKPSENNINAFTPLQITKAITLGILGMLSAVLLLDMYLVHQRRTVRIAGKNVAHLIFLAGIAIVVLVIRSGVVL